MTVEDLVQAQKEIMAHNMQLKEQTKQLEKDMAELKDQSLLLVRPSDIYQKRSEFCHLCIMKFIPVCSFLASCSGGYFSMLFLSKTVLFIPMQLKARCEELKLDWGSLCLETLLKEKAALRRQISEKQRHCLELQVPQIFKRRLQSTFAQVS